MSDDDRCLLCGAKDSELPKACLAVQRGTLCPAVSLGAMASAADAPSFEKAALCPSDKLWPAVQAERERRTHAAGVRAVVRMFSEASAAPTESARWPAAKDAWIQTYSGLVFRPFDPDPSMVRIEDIAHALSNVNRFNGHTRYPYSVAAHSIFVAMQLGGVEYRPPEGSDRRRMMLLGLLHDAAEAYFGDIVSPIKRHVPVFREMEARILAAIFVALGIDPPNLAEQALIEEVDLRALMTEKRDIHRPEPQAWAVDKVPFETRIVETPWRHVREKFSLLYADLRR